MEGWIVITTVITFVLAGLIPLVVFYAYRICYWAAYNRGLNQGYEDGWHDANASITPRQAAAILAQRRKKC
jgi:hypothetical protein